MIDHPLNGFFRYNDSWKINNLTILPTNDFRLRRNHRWSRCKPAMLFSFRIPRSWIRFLHYEEFTGNTLVCNWKTLLKIAMGFLWLPLWYAFITSFFSISTNYIIFKRWVNGYILVISYYMILRLGNEGKYGLRFEKTLFECSLHG